MEITEELVANIRSSIHKHLKLLADLEAQHEYQRNVPIANVPAELLCGWFDDSYHPETAAFQAAFAPQELDVLAEFNDLFAAAEVELPDRLPTLSALQAHPAWGRVVSGAAKALAGLSGRAV
jgi:hypothetical protein